MATSVDVLVVGSGPIGASYARLLAELRPQTSILMVELGPALTEPAGLNLGNLPEDERLQVALSSQGPDRDRRQSWERYAADGTAETAPGLHLVRAGGMPAAALASCVGGMGAHWSCVTPRPADGERVPFIAEANWEDAIATAERLLNVSSVPDVESDVGREIETILQGVFDPILPPDRRLEKLRSASQPGVDGRPLLTGVDTILGPAPKLLADRGGFELRSETICRSLTVEGDRVSGATLEHQATGAQTRVEARAIVVAADAFRTPQLLWASGIRPPALGRYLTGHPRWNARIELDPDKVPALATEEDLPQRLAAVHVPFVDPQHPFLGLVVALAESAVTTMDGASLRRSGRSTHKGYAMLNWLGRISPRVENGISFSDEHSDWCGMPAPTIDYALDEVARAESQIAGRHVDAAASALGTYVTGGEARMVPAGWSFHDMGTTRMGERDDGTSVCDAGSRVWGFENLFVGGNGVIPTATACNPTLMSVGLAAHSVVELVSVLQ